MAEVRPFRKVTNLCHFSLSYSKLNLPGRSPVLVCFYACRRIKILNITVKVVGSQATLKSLSSGQSTNKSVLSSKEH